MVILQKDDVNILSHAWIVHLFVIYEVLVLFSNFYQKGISFSYFPIYIYPTERKEIKKKLEIKNIYVTNKEL